MNRSKFRMPHTLVIMAVLLFGVWLLSLGLPSGQFRRIEKQYEGKVRQVAVPGTYHSVAKPSTGPECLLLSPVKGFQDGVLIIGFLFMVGGAFAIMQETSAVDGGIQRLSSFFARNPRLRFLLIPSLMVVFSLAGAVFGMSEETIPFVIVFIPLAMALGYDSIVGVAIPFLGAAAGFAAAFFNPFTVGVAQGFSELPLYSGLQYRLILWLIGTAIVIAYVMIYAERIRKNPEKSPVRDLDDEREGVSHSHESQWGWPQRLVLLGLGAGVALLVIGILKWKWYIEEIAALFLALGLLSGLLGRVSPSRMAQCLVNGAKDMVGVAFVIAFGRAVLLILQQALVLDTVLAGTASAISTMPRAIAPQAMFLTQCAINFFIHSGTAQAALTMPIMSPLADLVGITRQTAVLAFQLCEFVNPILPTSAVTMGVLGVAKIPWERWAKWFLPLMLLVVAFSMLALIPPMIMRWGPF